MILLLIHYLVVWCSIHFVFLYRNFMYCSCLLNVERASALDLGFQPLRLKIFIVGIFVWIFSIVLVWLTLALYIVVVWVLGAAKEERKDVDWFSSFAPSTLLAKLTRIDFWMLSDWCWSCCSIQESQVLIEARHLAVNYLENYLKVSRKILVINLAKFCIACCAAHHWDSGRRAQIVACHTMEFGNLDCLAVFVCGNFDRSVCVRSLDQYARSCPCQVRLENAGLW